MNRTVRTVILTLCAAILPAVLAGAADAKAPKVVVDEPIVDAGKVDSGARLALDFAIRNEGDAPLEITDVKPACGCTVAEYDRVIAPGATGAVHAVVDTTNFAGAFSKSITVFTNDPETPKLQLAVRAEIEPYLFVQPGFARFIQPQGSAPGEVKEIIWTKSFDDLKILELQSPYPYLTVSQRKAEGDEPREGGTGPQWVVTLRFDYEAAPVGTLADWVVIKTNHPRQSEIRIPVSGFVRPMIAVTPAEADFGEIEVAEPQVARMILRSFDPAGIEVTSATSDVPGVKVEVSPIEEGKRFNLVVTLLPDMPKGKVEGMITIRTTSESKPVVEVPLKATVS
jgi:hypothetical protein